MASALKADELLLAAMELLEILGRRGASEYPSGFKEAEQRLYLAVTENLMADAAS